MVDVDERGRRFGRDAVWLTLIVTTYSSSTFMNVCDPVTEKTWFWAS